MASHSSTVERRASGKAPGIVFCTWQFRNVTRLRIKPRHRYHFALVLDVRQINRTRLIRNEIYLGLQRSGAPGLGASNRNHARKSKGYRGGPSWRRPNAAKAPAQARCKNQNADCGGGETLSCVFSSGAPQQPPVGFPFIAGSGHDLREVWMTGVEEIVYFGRDDRARHRKHRARSLLHRMRLTSAVLRAAVNGGNLVPTKCLN